MTDILPDSRPRNQRNVIRSPIGNLVPVFCAGCGKPWGMVPEKYMTFVFVLCDDVCVPKYGKVAHLHSEPDQAFWQRVAHETDAEKKKQPELTINQLLQKSLDNPQSQLSKLAKEWDSLYDKSGNSNFCRR